MIYIGKHSKKFEKEFCNIALEELDAHVNVLEFVHECKKFIPEFIIEADDPEAFLKQLILLPYCKIKKIYKHITNSASIQYNNTVFDSGKLRDVFEDYHDCYEKLRDHSWKKKVCIAVTEDLNLTVCPYCNRDYINGRSDDNSGCQLDHFFCRSQYPFLAVSLYNLVPSCSVCNNIKRENVELVSPFDDKFKFDIELKFKYIGEKDQIELERDCESKININIDKLKLEEAYEIHKLDVRKILDKKETYVASNLDEIANCINDWSDNERKGVKIDRHYLQNLIYGEKLTAADYKTCALGKLKHDILEYYNVYE